MEEGFNLVLAVLSAKPFLCEMIQLPQYLWILHTLRVDTYIYLYIHIHIYTYIYILFHIYIYIYIYIQTRKLVFIQAMIPYHRNAYPTEYHMRAEVAALCGLHCSNTIWLINFIWFDYDVS